jgi:PPP family 3-phenylpropionic acid transporter
VSAALPFVRISAFYACYFGAIGVLLPYLGLYLRHSGYSAIAIGQLMAVLMAMRILAPGLWAWWADATGWRTVLMRSAAIAAPLMFLGVIQGDSFAGLAVALGLFGIAWAGVLPQFEANTLDHLGEEPQRYGRMRLWGSLGFIMAVVVGGLLFSGDRVDLVPAVALGLLVMTAVAIVLTPPAAGEPRDRPRGRLLSVLRRREVLGLLIGCVLLQASFGTYYVFFTIYLRDLGYSSQTAGLMWAWGVAAEIAVFAYTPRLLERWSAHGLLTVALAATSVRWLMTAWFSGNLGMLLFAQTLHLAGFGISHAVAVYLIHRYFEGSLQNRGQALYSSLGFGLGGAAGSLAAGYLWDLEGSTTAWIGSALLALLAAITIRITASRGREAMVAGAD